MEEKQILELLTEVGGLNNQNAIYAHPYDTSQLCKLIAEHFTKRRIEVVVAPAVGGAILSQWTAFHLQRRNTTHGVDEVLGVYAEKEVIAIPDPEGKDRLCYAKTGNFVFPHGYDKLVAGKKVLIVDNPLTADGPVKKIVEAVRGIAGEVVGVGAICNHSGVTAKDIGNVPELFSLVNIEPET